MDVALIHEEVPGLTKVFRRLQRGEQEVAHAGGIVMHESSLCQQKVSADMLTERKAFPAFPRLKGVGAKDGQGFFRLRSLIVEGDEFNSELVPAVDECEVAFQHGESFLWAFANALPELIAFIEDSRVRRVGLECGVVGRNAAAGSLRTLK